MLGRDGVGGDGKVGGPSVAARGDGPLRYDREHMKRLAESKLCKLRPAYLSTEFDNEEGVFSPFKWLEYRWATEGIENRPVTAVRRKEKIKNDALDGDSTVLSPQRRGFSSGCRAPSPNKADGDSERQTTKGSWRSGAGYQLKPSSATTDFKPAFLQQKNTGSESSYSRNRATNGIASNWRSGAGDAFKPSFHRDPHNRNRQSGASGDEKVPEWLNDGPESMLDMIELKGFDDEHSTKRGSLAKGKKDGGSHGNAKQQQQARANAPSRGASAAVERTTLATGSVAVTCTATATTATATATTTTASSATAGGANCSASTESGTDSRPSSIASVNSAPGRSSATAKGDDSGGGGGGSGASGEVHDVAVVAEGTQPATAAVPSAKSSNKAGGVTSSPTAVATATTTSAEVRTSPSDDGRPPSAQHPSSKASSSVNVSTAGSARPTAADTVAVSSKGPAGEIPLLNCKLPNSDAEFAAIMGILGEGDLHAFKENGASSSPVVSSTTESAPSVTGSRLSRFFATNANGENRNAVGSGRASFEPTNVGGSGSCASPSATPSSSNSVLQKIFANSPQRSAQSPLLFDSRGPASMPGMMRVEDLERGFQQDAARSSSAAGLAAGGAAGDVPSIGVDPRAFPISRQQLAFSQISKGNPLGDPNQQAHLMNKLAKFARQQDLGVNDEGSTLRPAGISHSPPPSLHSAAGGLPTGIPDGSGEVPSMDPAALQAVFLRSQYENALLHALNQQRAVSVQQQQQGATLRNFASGGLPSAGGGSVGRGASGMPNAFMPTSVMRQLTKNASLDDKLRRGGGAGSGDDDPMHSANEQQQQQLLHAINKQNMEGGMSGGMPGGSGPAALPGGTDAMTKLALQQQYAQVMAAMQGGLSMGAYRPPAQLAAAMRSQALAAAQAEHQRAFAMALMRGDLGQAQVIRARFLSQQAAAVANLPSLAGANVPLPGPPIPHMVPMQQHMASSKVVPQATVPTSSSGGGAQPGGAPAGGAAGAGAPAGSFKYQNPLEKLLQSAGIPSTQNPRTLAAHNSAMPATTHGGGPPSSTSSGMPSIVSRLPPQAHCISLEELERQFAAN